MGELESGPVERAVQADIEAMDLSSPLCGSYAQSALNLARKLDGDAGMATAAVARELRETLKALREAAGDDDGTRELLSELSAPLGDTAAP